MERYKISVIIVAYKVSQYLDRCLESVVNQTYENLEIIVVAGEDPNGFDDGCLTICRKYVAKDKRIKLVTCKAAGVSDARNRGLAAVTGDLIGFVDGDDYIDRDMYATMAAHYAKFRAQIVVCGRYYEYRNGTLSDLLPEKGAYVMNGEEALEMVLRGDGFYLHCWDKLYSKDLWKDVEFPIDSYVEDRIVINRILSKANRVVYDSTPKYHFRERLGSLSKTGEIAKNNTIANKELARFIYEKHPGLSARCDRYLVYEYITAIQNVYLSEKKIDRKEVSLYKKELLKLLPRLGRNPYTDWRIQAKLLIALFSPGILAINTKRKNKGNPLMRFQ